RATLDGVPIVCPRPICRFGWFLQLLEKKWSGWPDSNRRPPDPQLLLHYCRFASTRVPIGFCVTVNCRLQPVWERCSDIRCTMLQVPLARLKRAHRVVLRRGRAREIRARLADVRVPEPALDRGDRDAAVHPA